MPNRNTSPTGSPRTLITDLSKVCGLFVIARNSSFVYKGRSARGRTSDADLGVRFVLEGSVRKAGNRVRITAQLIDAGNDGHLWAERFDRDLTDIFSTQDEVVEKIVGALAITLTPGEEQRLRRRGTDNVETATLGCGHANSSVGARANRCCRRARCTTAQLRWIPLSRCRMQDWRFAGIMDYLNDWAADPAAALDDAERCARRALELGPQEPVSHLALGNVLLWRRDHDGALSEFRRALALDRSYAQGYSATGMVLMYAGRPAEALEPIAMAMGASDPHYATDRAAFPGAGAFRPGELRDRGPLPPRSHRTQSQYRREPYAARVLLRPPRARRRCAQDLGGVARGQSRVSTDAARAGAAVQGSQ